MRAIYCITNKENGKKYVGKSINVFDRLQDHLKALLKNSHPSKEMQNDFNEVESIGFSFEILEICGPSNIKQKEGFWMQQLEAATKGYNMLYWKEEGLQRFEDPKKKEKLIKKCFSVASGCNIAQVSFCHLDSDSIECVKDIFCGDINLLRQESEILVIPDSYQQYRSPPFILIEEDLEDKLYLEKIKLSF